MGPYILLWIGACFSVFFPLQASQKTNNYIFSISSLFLIIFIGLRHEVGGDWTNYLMMQDAITYLSFSQSIVVTDPAYGALNWVANYFNLGIYPVNLVCAAIFILGLRALCLKQPSVSIALLVSIPYLITAVAMGYTRQAAALGFVMMAFVSIIDRSHRKFIFWVLCAVLFHKSAIIMLSFLPLAMAHVQVKKIFLFLCALLPIAIYSVIHVLGSMWELYVESNMESDGAMIRVIMNAIPALFFIYYRNSFKERWPEIYKLAFWLSICSIASIPLVFIVSTVIDRISLFFIPIQIIIYSRIVFLFTGNIRYLILFFIVVLYSLSYFTWLFFSYWAQLRWVPYQNLLFI